MCDVNGWSFVKANPKYWDDCSILLKTQIFSKFFPDKKVSAAKNMEKNYERFSKNLENAFRPPMDTLCMKR